MKFSLQIITGAHLPTFLFPSSYISATLTYSFPSKQLILILHFRGNSEILGPYQETSVACPESTLLLQIFPAMSNFTSFFFVEDCFESIMINMELSSSS